jgi:hypothetical protein
MRLRTRKWGCALGLTLLITVPVGLAVWIWQALSVPTAPDSPEAMVRSWPLYPTARDASYHTTYSIPSDPWRESTSWVTFRVSGPSQPIIDFYANRLMEEGWEPYIVWTHLKKTLEIPDGIRFGERPPWLRRAYREVGCEVIVQTEELPEVLDERKKYTRVTVTLQTPHSVP